MAEIGRFSGDNAEGFGQKSYEKPEGFWGYIVKLEFYVNK